VPPVQPPLDVKISLSLPPSTVTIEHDTNRNPYFRSSWRDFANKLQWKSSLKEVQEVELPYALTQGSR
jgi:hypothetical protein